MRNRILFMLIAVFSLASCAPGPEIETLVSPDGSNRIQFFLTPAGQPAYRVYHAEELIIDTSSLGMVFQGQPELAEGMEILTLEVSEKDENWEMPWGEVETVRNHYKEMKVDLREKAGPNREMTLYFRAYDDGIAFRYAFPKQENLRDVVIRDENTEFSLTGDHTVWWIPGDWDIYEHLYNQTLFSEIDALSKRDHPNLAQSYIPENAVNTPVTMKTADGLYLSFHEANLTDYSGMTLKVDPENLRMTSELVGSPDGSKVKTQAPFVTPWRTIQIAERPGDLIESHLIVNLNEPSQIEDVSWIQPMKYMGIWWAMHLDKWTWNRASGRHGATTEHAKAYIDFAAENGIQGMLIEGWNTGWERWIGFPDREGVFDFVTPYPDFDLEEVVAYAREKGVEIIGHHETSAAVTTYNEQMDTAFQLYQSLGIRAVKTGYVGPIIPEGEFHHGHYMVKHYRKVVETAAKYGIMIDAHEPIKATGIRRTWPNMMTREGLRGQEFNAFSVEGGNNLEHTLVVPFTRMLAGPIDYTPGVFNLLLDPFKPDNRVRHTLAHELALYVILYSPLQMLCDLPENLEGQPGLQFVRDVGVDWSVTQVLDGEIGEHITIARKERGTGNWFLGSITGNGKREVKIKLDFLEEGVSYVADIYWDAEDANWETNPHALEITNSKFKKGDELILNLASGGGAAVSFLKE